jgi:hypothetical protein
MATFTVNASISTQLNFNISGTMSNVDFGDGSPLQTFTNTNVIYNYTTPGIYTVTFTSTNLTGIDFSNNYNITSANISGSPNLKAFGANNQPKLTSVDLSNCAILDKVSISNSFELISLTLTNSTLLNSLTVNRSKLATINLSTNVNVTALTISNSKLTTINLSTLSLLKSLSLFNNELTGITFGTHNILDKVDCSFNNLTSFTTSGMPVLSSLYLNFNQLTSLNISSSTDLTVLQLIGNNLNSSTITSILVTLDGFGDCCGTLFINNQTPSVVISPVGLAAIQNLQSRSWAVVYDDRKGNLLYGIEIQYCGENVVNIQNLSTNTNPDNGDVYDVESGEGVKCAQVVGIRAADYTFKIGLPIEGPYVDCATCVNNDAVLVGSCNGKEEFVLKFSAFTGTVEIGDVLYLNFVYPNTIDPFEPDFNIVGCFKINKFFRSNSKNIFGVLTSETPYLDCGECLSANSQTYLVYHCNDFSQTHYISLPDNSLVGHLITFNDIGSGLEQFCGIVDSQQSGSVDITLINDLGLYTEELCTQCLSTVAEKRVIIDCLDSEHTEVVWNSVFFEAGDVSNLSTNDGCFEVGSLTEDPVTIQTFLDFDPQPDCPDCIQCNGITYNANSCNGEILNVTISAYQFMTVGEVFYHPEFRQCFTVVGRTPGLATQPYYSLRTFGESCSLCEVEGGEIWEAQICGQPNIIQIATPSGMTAGDITHIKWGDTDFACVTLLSKTGVEGFASFASDGITHDDCDTCLSTIQLGITLINCRTGIERYAIISSNVWFNIVGITGVGYPVISDNQYNCYYVSNFCPITIQEGAQQITPQDYYFNCIDCLSSNINPREPRSANTETYICNYCCDCGASGETINQVVVPHPIWTDPYGVWVTQMNMVLIGSGNGLNA